MLVGGEIDGEGDCKDERGRLFIGGRGKEIHTGHVFVETPDEKMTLTWGAWGDSMEFLTLTFSSLE
jgi:hypothetical protein